MPLVKNTRTKPFRPIGLSIFGVQALLWAVMWAATGRWWIYPLLWFLPWMTEWRVINRLRSIAEHGGMERSADRRATTHNVRQSWLARFWIVPYNTGWHLAHHVDMGVPWRNLPAFHAELERAGYITEAITYKSYWALWKALSSADETTEVKATACLMPSDGRRRAAPVVHRRFRAPDRGTVRRCSSGTTRSARPRTAARPALGPRRSAAARSSLAAVLLAPHHARAAAAQDWPPFVLVAGLLLVGLVADGDRLFAAGGHALARLAPNGVLLYLGTVVLVLAVTTLLNLDTSVTFLTPVLVYAARSRGEGEAPLLYACLLLSNAGSLLLPGSNLTNLIVLGHLHLSGRAFLAHMALPALAAAAVTALVVGAVYHRSLRTTVVPTIEAGAPGARASAWWPSSSSRCSSWRCARRRCRWPRSGWSPSLSAPGAAGRPARSARSAAQVLGVPVLVGLFGLAVALGTLGRSWSGPATLLSHLDAWGTAAVAAADAACW